MRILLSLLLASFATIAIAEPKQLVCELPAEPEEKELREVANKHRDPSWEWYSLEEAERYDGYADLCLSAAFGRQISFVFDTEGLNNPIFASVEVSDTQVCGGIVRDVRKGTVETTPSVISFTLQGLVNLITINVDRKTLKAGFFTERNFTCVLKDIDTSENLL